MEVAILPRINNCEQVVRETVSLLHSAEKELVELKMLQKSNQEDIKDLHHTQKNTQIAIKMFQDHVERQLQEIKEKLAAHTVKEETKNQMFKSWHMWLLLGLAIFGSVMSIYDRIAEHAVKVVGGS